MKLRLPLRGVSEVLPDSQQAEDTTRDMLNMRGIDPRTKKVRLSSRSGLVKYLDSLAIGRAAPIRALRSVTFQRRNIVYTDKVSSSSVSLGTDDVTHSLRTSSGLPVLNIDTDKEGNVYGIDGLAAAGKWNSLLELQWTQSLPVRQSGATVRALRVASMVGLVDADSEALFAGVSEGGLQKDALLWGYKQISTRDEDGKVETKTEQIFELEPKAFTEQIRVRNGFLYAAQNEPDKGRAYVRVYHGLTTPHPEVAFEFEVPYPINDVDVRESDGAIITAHGPNATRGKDPRNTIYSPRDLALEWKISDLTDYDKRIWSDFNAANVKDALSVEDGDAIDLWPDDGPSFRSLTQGALKDQPIYVENGIGGKPAIRFIGNVTGFESRMVSQPNPATAAQFDDQQRTIVPMFDGSRYAIFIVGRLPLEDVSRPILYQDNDSPSGSDANTDELVSNSSSADNLSFNGKLKWFSACDSTVGLAAGLATTGGARRVPFSGDYAVGGSGGTFILTIINDGHANSTTDQAQHSTIRVDGRPLDRWINLRSSGADATQVGSGPATAPFGATTFLAGDIARIVVFRDYPTGGVHGDPLTGALDSAGTSHYPRTVAATLAGSTVKNFAANSTNRYNDNEIERIEGVLAAEYGISHLLPCGTASVLSATANFAAGETVVIGPAGASSTYTFVAALTGAFREVLVGANTVASMANLFRAINATGTPGTDYDADVLENVYARATCFNDQDVTNATAKIKIESRTEATVNCTETCANASWSNNPTGTVNSVASPIASYMPGHYPHPFSQSYGFPRKDTATQLGIEQESKGKLLNSQEGILARWDANGKIVWVATSRESVVYGGAITLPAANEHYGGIGWACAFGNDEDRDVIYSTGPQYTTSPTTAQEVGILRRIVDNTTSVSMTGTGTWVMSQTDLTGAIIAFANQNNRLRIAVDTFDNVYLPYLDQVANNDSDGAGLDVRSLVCVETIDVAGVPTARVAWTWRKADSTTNPGGLCVAVDKKLPDYDGDPATRALAVYLGTSMGYTVDDSTQDNLYRIEAVSVDHLTGVSASETRLCAVADGELWTSLSGAAWAEPFGPNSLLNPVFVTDTDAPDNYVSLCSLNGHLFGTDGKSYIDYDGRKDIMVEMKSKSAGELKPRARCVEAWRGRLVWYRFADNPHEYLMSAIGNPYDYDISPPVQTATQAVLGTKAPRGTGQAPDIINTVIPFNDDTLIFGCQSSIYRLDGDPMDNGRFVIMSDATGLAFGQSWCKDENDVIYGFGTRGIVYTITGRGVNPLSEYGIPTRLSAIDFAVTRVRMAWDNEEQGFHLFMSPVDPTDPQIVEHYFWSRKTKGWYPDSFSTADLQPTATFSGDGDLGLNRRCVIGCADGYVRAFDSTATDDDGELILSRALIGPLTADESPVETHFKELRGVLANAQGACGYQLFASETPDDLGTAVASGVLEPGRNGTHFVQAVGSYVALEVSNSTLTGFSIESLDMDAYPAGRK